MHNPLLRLAPLALLIAASPVPIAPAMEIELGLNLFFTDPFDSGSGGVWQVVGRSSDFGIHSVTFAVDGVNSPANRDAPFGTVNGEAVPNAGFSVFFGGLFGDTASVAISHRFIPAADGAETGEFYGFGVIENGSPGDLGPTITTLSTAGPDGGGILPWAAGDPLNDPAFDAFAQIASGTFAPGQTPVFSTDPFNFGGQVFESILGVDATTAAELSGELGGDAIIRNAARTNLVTTDLNLDNTINAADFTIIRDTFGAAATPAGSGGDADGNGVVDLEDYNDWVAQFGAADSPVSVVSGVIATPEPGAACLLLVGLGLGGIRRQKKPQLASKPLFLQGLRCHPKKSEYDRKLLDSPVA